MTQLLLRRIQSRDENLTLRVNQSTHLRWICGLIMNILLLMLFFLNTDYEEEDWLDKLGPFSCEFLFLWLHVGIDW